MHRMNRWARYLQEAPATLQRLIARHNRISLPRGCSAKEQLFVGLLAMMLIMAALPFSLPTAPTPTHAADPLVPSLVKDITPGNDGFSPKELTEVNGRFFFTATDDTHGYELWVSDGTEAGTTLVKDIYPGSRDSLNWNAEWLTEMNGRLFFTT